MNRQLSSLLKSIAIAAILAIPLIVYSRQFFLRPPRSEQQQALFRGIVYKREARSLPRPIVIHVIAIDLTAPGLKPFVTPGNSDRDESYLTARTTSDFLNEFKLQLAINANYFHPFREDTPWSYVPNSGDDANPQGQSISNGKTYSVAQGDRPALCFAADNRAQIVSDGQCPSDTANAVAGYRVLLNDGKPLVQAFTTGNERKPYPCVAAAIDKDGKKLWIVAVDGKQPLYSEGVTMVELGEMLRELGAYKAINLDGGGSTTLVTSVENGEVKLLNAPIHTKVPMRERPVANHLGFYAIELEKL